MEASHEVTGLPFSKNNRPASESVSISSTFLTALSSSITSTKTTIPSTSFLPAKARIYGPQQSRSMALYFDPISNTNQEIKSEFDLAHTTAPRHASSGTLESFPPLSPRLVPTPKSGLNLIPQDMTSVAMGARQKKLQEQEKRGSPSRGRSRNKRQMQNQSHRQGRNQIRTQSQRQNRSKREQERGRKLSFGTFTNTIFFQHTGTYPYLSGKRLRSLVHHGPWDEEVGEEEGQENLRGFRGKFGLCVVHFVLALLVAIACLALGALIGFSLKLLVPDWVDSWFLG